MRSLHIGRTTTTFTLSPVFPRFGRRTSAATWVAFLHLPAFFSACSSPSDTAVFKTSTQIYITRSEKTTLRELDLFFFDDDPPARLDAYQHIGEAGLSRVDGISCNGDKRIVALSGFTGGIYAWSDIQSYGTLAGRTFRLEDEDPEAPLLYGECRVSAGVSRSCGITLRPSLARIRVRSVACDFSDRPYDGATLDHLRLYLTHVSRECHPMQKNGETPFSWLNAGALDEAATGALAHPEMVFRAPDIRVGAERRQLDLDFFCYPNPVQEEAFGQPFTRLVIEGQIQGTTWYYPVSLPGLEGDTGYEVDITLTRTGSTDPDTPVSSGTVLLETDTVPWTPADPYTVLF